MLGCNLDGTHKLPLFIIGTAAQPNNFNKKLRNKLFNEKSLYYKSNKSAWMTSTYFHDYLSDLNGLFRKQNRNVLFFVDGPSQHKLESFDKSINQLTKHPFSNIKVYYFPPNTTAILQPMDQGTILSFKCHYRRLMSLKLIDQAKKKLSLSSQDKICDFKINKYAYRCLNKRGLSTMREFTNTAVRGKKVFEHGFAEIIEEFDEMNKDNRKYRLLKPTIQIIIETVDRYINKGPNLRYCAKIRTLLVLYYLSRG